VIHQSRRSRSHSYRYVKHTKTTTSDNNFYLAIFLCECGACGLLAVQYAFPIGVVSFESASMAKVYFYYSAMNAGKSTVLLQSSHNYRERGMNTLLLTPEIDKRAGAGRIASRIGLEKEAESFSRESDLFVRIAQLTDQASLACVLIDEAQFLTTAQVRQLCRVADELDIPVLGYGLRTDFRGDLFEGSAALLGWADTLNEIKTICHCGRKATMNLRLGPDGRAVNDGDQIEIGGNGRYVAMCRRHFAKALHAS